MTPLTTLIPSGVLVLYTATYAVVTHFIVVMAMVKVPNSPQITLNLVPKPPTLTNLGPYLSSINLY